MLDALGAAELHFDIQRPQRKALGRQSALDDIERARARLADYERNQGQIGRAHPVAAQRAIAGGSHEHQLVLHESLVAKRRTGGLSLDQADIDPLVGDQTLDPLRVTVGHGHADVGIAFPETRQYGREHVLRQRRTRAEGYLSAGHGSVRRKSLVQLSVKRQDPAGIAQQPFAFRSQRNRSSPAQEQRHAELPFQLADVLRNGGLRNEKLGGGAREAQLLGSRSEYPESEIGDHAAKVLGMKLRYRRTKPSAGRNRPSRPHRLPSGTCDSSREADRVCLRTAASARKNRRV